jgi:hypothetical protein
MRFAHAQAMAFRAAEKGPSEPLSAADAHDEIDVAFNSTEILAFNQIHAFVITKKDTFCVVPISTFLLVLYEVITTHRNWEILLQILRA